MRNTWPIALVAMMCACRAAAPAAERAPEEPSKRAVASLTEAREALREWRTQIGVSGEVEPASFREITEATQGVGVELQALSKRVKGGSPTSTERRTESSPRVERAPAAAYSTSKAWIDDVRALGAEASERRERALAAVRGALTGSDTQGQIAALMTLQSVGDVEYDKASFRPLVLPFAEKSVSPAIVPALYALANTKREPADLALVHAAWGRDPAALSDSVLHLMTMFGDGRLDGRSEEIALEWLSTYPGGNRGINGMWGARVGPKLEAKVIELARSTDPEIRHAAIYFGLSTFEDKSAAVVEELITALTDPDHNNSGHALWGLGHGVPDAQKPRVVEALIELHNARSDPQTRKSCARTVAQYGGDEAAARLAR